MTIESALGVALAQIPDVTALIGNRVFPVAAPQTAGRPFVTYKRVPGDVNYTQGGESDLKRATFQVAAVAETYDTVIALAQAIRDGLSGKRGALGDGSVKVSPIFLRDPEDAWNQETGLFVRTQELRILYKVAT
jgi:hypothetical protein